MATLGRTHVPLEVLTSVLKHLSQDELRNASGVSQVFYHAAHDVGLFLYRTVHSEHQSTLVTFVDVVQHARAQRHMFRLGLNLMIFRRNEEDTTGVPSLEAIWDALRMSVPFLVVLHSRLYSTLVAACYTALDIPALQLRTLSLLVHDDQANPATIPPTLLGGEAPRLHTVELNGPVLPLVSARIAAWSGVRTLKACVHYAGQQLPISHCFPALSDLAFNIGRRNVLDLVGLALNSLTIKNDSGASLQYGFDASGAQAPRVREFNDICRAVHYDERHWPAEDVLLHAHIQQTVYDVCRGKCAQYKLTPRDLLSAYDTERRLHIGETVSVGSADSACDWRITQYTKPVPLPGLEIHTLGTLDALPPLLTRIISLTIDKALLVRLLQTSSRLDVLLELYVDCTAVPAPPPKWNWLYHPMGPTLSALFLRRPALRCPALERAVLFATGREPPVAVGRGRIAAVGLLHSDVRPALVLSRVIVDDDDDTAPLLEDVFASVHVEKTQADKYVPDYYHHREDNPRLSK